MVLGYGFGIYVFGRCIDCNFCFVGNVVMEFYIVVYNVLFVYVVVVDVYRKKFKVIQGGMMGIVVDIEWVEFMISFVVDKEVVEQYLFFQLGWYDVY